MSIDADVPENTGLAAGGGAFVRTTVTLRADYFQRLKRRGGNRGLSSALNEILAREFARTHALFGVDRKRKLDLEDLRDHEDH